MSRFTLYSIPVVISLILILFPVINPGAINVNADACGEYCECKHQCSEIIANNALVQIPAQPMNTWSNIAFLVVGLMALRRRKGPAARWFAISCAVLCLGSGAFHSFLTVAGQRWDVIGMFFVFNFLAVYAMFVMHENAKTEAHELRWFRIAVLLSAIVSVVMAIFVVDLDSTKVLAIASAFIIGHLILAVIEKSASLKEVLLALSPFAVAFVFRQLDVNGTLCDPTSWFQGHAVWHVFAAWGIYEIYKLLDVIRHER